MESIKFSLLQKDDHLLQVSRPQSMLVCPSMTTVKRMSGHDEASWAGSCSQHLRVWVLTMHAFLAPKSRAPYTAANQVPR